MTGNELKEYIHELTTTNEQTFEDSRVLLFVNLARDDIAKEIVRENEDYFGERSYMNLEKGRREYRFPGDLLSNIKAVEAKIDGENWERLDEIDLNDGYDGNMDEESIQANFSGKKSRFDVYRSALWILSGAPIEDVEEGLVLWHMVYPPKMTEFTDDDMAEWKDKKQRSFPRQFHELIGRRTSILYKSSRPRPIPLTEQEQMFEMDLQKALRSIRGLNLDRSIIASVPKDDGSNY